ncbi:hypothetical protein F4801DRAFT_511145 [Xylaria longipes]|nr:hypothetical protein F4801DRAFT_511145 [Xylaria longipes]RYC63250.1 hypothetical protein CHU98_g2973 [Xylaria longipes]
MKFQLSAALVGLAAMAASAQETQSGPFNLHIKGTKHNSKINGYGESCHTGAGISALCYSNISSPEDANFYQYYFNYTGYNKVGDDEVGTLVWNSPYTDQDGNPAFESEYMGLVFSTTSNVAAPMFGYSQSTFLIGFNSEGEIFGYNYVDDSKNVPDKVPIENTPKAYYQWAVCWQYFTGYYYQSVAWVQIGAPHNPTCESVEITKVEV